MTPEAEASWNNIVDCMACTDGCLNFVRLKALVEDMDARAQEHTPDGAAAFQIMRVVHQFSLLIDMASGKLKPEE